MSTAGDGYCSEFHFRSLLNHHHDLLYERVERVTGAQSIDWKNNRSPEGECKNLGFLPKGSSVRKKWKEFRPTCGNQHIWDAVGRISIEN
ncbi:MAG: hypothetical protein OXL39_09395 [Caldilineaceae bacterium]|nr:hypothetical protein [Caldilineaceae bacterium]